MLFLCNSYQVKGDQVAEEHLSRKLYLKQQSQHRFTAIQFPTVLFEMAKNFALSL
jgi:hypothetical protein